ncbi:MAG: hypothetical protein CMB99_16395 [Flavobacteriaceae bacterium]|nr:hypothetical protein [Flavobacteriaceae bacterium]|tara:strand:- start:31371 stop:31832 length:462 start_codon:yes stop_codon:yes gene_type:complete
MIATLITDWVDSVLSAIDKTKGFYTSPDISHSFADKPADMSELASPLLIIETTDNPVNQVPTGQRVESIQLSRKVYINGFIPVPDGERPSDHLDRLLFDVRKAIYPTPKQLSNNTTFQIQETEARYLYPQVGSKVARFVLAFNFIHHENFKEG